MSFRKYLIGVVLLVLIAGCASTGVDAPPPAATIGDKSIADKHNDRRLDAALTIDNEEHVVPGLPVFRLTNDDKIPSLPLYRLARNEKIVAVQVLLFNCPTLREVEGKIKELKRAGVNTLIFRVFQNRGDRFYPFARPLNEVGVYFNSAHAPVVGDILGDLARISRANDMKIFAWMTTRYADYGMENKKGWQAVKYDLGSERFTPAKGLNLFRRDVKNHLGSLYRDLAAYDIDGILFQDDLVLKHTEGFSHDARNAFAAEFGQMPNHKDFYKGVFTAEDGRQMVSSYGEGFWKWSRWKNRALLNVASEIMKEVKRIKPDMKFAINLMYEAAIYPENALAWLSQDLDEAVRTGFDLYAIMAYHRQMARELNVKGVALDSLMSKLVEKTLEKVKDPAKVLIKLQISDWETQEIVSHEEINSMLRLINKKGSPSLAFVPYRDSFDFRKVAPFLGHDHDLRLASASEK
ncbi:MAG: poly-beta-1,6-N-acetyl-D-glucosamine N-deacetylase PgaB [bacterium]|nr:poly-beta-1,6-N-acetyl-D-glucosamine N-deacetylase PgaB [bacterium]